MAIDTVYDSTMLVAERFCFAFASRDEALVFLPVIVLLTNHDVFDFLVDCVVGCSRRKRLHHPDVRDLLFCNGLY